MENKVSKTLHSIGICTIVLGIIGSIIMGFVFPSVTYDYSYFSGYDIEESYNFAIALIGSGSSYVSGMMFIGFSEIIKLLQQSVDANKEIIDCLQAAKENCESPKSILQDIESNLPEM